VFTEVEKPQEGLALGAQRKSGLARLGAAAPWIAPKVSVLGATRWRGRVLLIAGAAACAAIVWFLGSFLNGIQERAARKGSTRFAAGPRP
jgi:hypothetical protein